MRKKPKTICEVSTEGAIITKTEQPCSPPTINKAYSLKGKISKRKHALDFPDDNIAKYKNKDTDKMKEIMKSLRDVRKKCIEMDLEGRYNNVIGQRLLHLLEISKMTTVTLSTEAKVNRATISRILNGGIPVPTTLAKFLEPLDCDVSVFTYDLEAPYEEWEDECDKDYRLRFDWADAELYTMKYSVLKEVVLAYARNDLIDDNNKRIPDKHRLLFQQLLCSAFDTMDVLLEETQKKKIPLKK